MDALERGVELGPKEMAWLILEKQIFPLNRTVINIGRQLENDIVLQHLTVSRRHAQIRYEEGDFVIHDLDSTGGTYVNSQRVGKHQLRPGDIIILSDVVLVFVDDTPQIMDKSQDKTSGLE